MALAGSDEIRGSPMLIPEEPVQVGFYSELRYKMLISKHMSEGR